MFSLASKLTFGITATAVAFAIGYGRAVDERAGVILFLFVALSAAIAGVALGGQTVPDLAPDIEADAPPPERQATTTAPPPQGTGWTLVAAVAVTVLAVGAAVSKDLVIAGVIAVAVAVAGWFARVWGDHPAWTPRVQDRVSSRLLVPVGLPVASVLMALTIAFSVSRIFLAVSKEGAVLASVVLAVVILSACAWVATRPRIASSAVIALAALAATSMVGAGITGAVAGEREFEAHEGHEGVIEIEAEEVAFDKDSIVVEAGKPVTIDFVNLDEDVYHNVAVYAGEGPEAKPVFNGEGFAGDDERVYEFEAPAAGAYTFVCDFHPNMKGAFVVEAAGE